MGSIMRGIKQFYSATLLAVALSTPLAAQEAAKPAPPATEPATPHTAADFATLPFVQGAVMSPDGKWLGGLFGVEGSRRVCILPLLADQGKGQCALMPDMTEARSVEWVGNDNLLIHISKLLPVDLDRWYVSRLVSLNRKTGKLTLLLWDLKGQDGDDVLWTARDGSPFALVAGQNSIYKEPEFWPGIYRVNVETGSRSRVQSGREDVMKWVADPDGEVRLGYGYNDDVRRSRLLYRKDKSASFRVIDRADERQREGLLSLEGFGSAPESVLLVHEDSDKHSALFEADLNSGKDLRKIWTAPEGSWIADTIMAEDGKTVLGLWLGGKRRERIWLDPVLAQLQADFDKSVPDRRVSITSFSSDRKQMLVTIDRADTPGALYFFDINDGTLHRVAFLSTPLKGERLNPVKAVTYKARDGLEIEAILTLPQGREAKKLPVVVMPHGGPWAHDTLDYDYWAQFVAGLGYAVIQPNFRGSTGYGEDFKRKGEGQLGLAMQDDLNDALKYVVDQGIGDGARACIVGASYGGYAALWGLARDAGLWRCGIAISGISSLRRDVNDMGDSLTGNRNMDAWKRMTPDFAAVSPLNFVDRIKAPLLMVHGKMDVTVDHSQSVSMANRMAAAGKPHEFLSLPKADHYFTRESDRLALLKAMEAFLKKNNPPQ